MQKTLLILACISCLSILGAEPDKKFLKNTDFVFIPSGSLTSQITNSVVSIHAFYILRTELTNLQYLEFLYDLKTQNKTEEYKRALPDTSKWNTEGTYMQAYVDYYFRHPAYMNYPLVNVSLEGATMYCDWLTEKLRKLYPEMQFAEVRLPTAAEWEYAASGGLNAHYYSWGSDHVTDSEGEKMGNFLSIGDERISRNDTGFYITDWRLNSNLEEIHADLVAPAESYKPNSFGLYNMSGNAAELAYLKTSTSVDLNAEKTDTVAMGGSWNSPGFDIRIYSYQHFKEANPFTGFRPVITYIAQ